MSKPEHYYCDHGICLKCEPCSQCQAAKEGKEAAKRAMELAFRVAQRAGQRETK